MKKRRVTWQDRIRHLFYLMFPYAEVASGTT